jgi:hypothetical protein
MKRPEGYTLVIESWGAGFFSNFNGVVNNLSHRLGRGGVEAVSVEWHADPAKPGFCYGNPQDGNLWLYFFEPLPFPEAPAARHVARGYADFAMTHRFAYAMYKLDRRWRGRYHAVYQRYIRVRPEILDRVTAIHQASMAGRYCVGVHYRHPAHDKECMDPIPAPETFIARLRAMLPTGGEWVVVLATDFEIVVPAFRDAFGDRLVLQPGVWRGDGISRSDPHEEVDTPALVLGEQVLVDCLLLAKCDALLHVTSNLATAAGYINPTMKMIYCESVGQAARGYFWSVTRAPIALSHHPNMLPPAVGTMLRRAHRLYRMLTGRPAIS